LIEISQIAIWESASLLCRRRTKGRKGSKESVACSDRREYYRTEGERTEN
jgi:hypothetical protein